MPQSYAIIRSSWMLMLLLSTPFTTAAEPGLQDGRRNALLINDCTLSLINDVTLAAERSGVLRELKVAEGDQVALHALVARLADEEAVANLELVRCAAENDIAIQLAEKTHAVAEVELQQAEALNSRRQVYTEYELRRLRLTLDKTELECQQALHDQQLRRLEQSVADAQLKSFEVRSTFAGSVVRVYLSEGEAVQQGEPIMRVVDASRLRVEGFVPFTQSKQLRPGLPVTVNLERTNPPVTLRGRLKFVDVSVQSVTQEVRIWAEVDNSTGLGRPGLAVQMRIFPSDSQDAEGSAGITQAGSKSMK